MAFCGESQTPRKIAPTIPRAEGNGSPERFGLTPNRVAAKLLVLALAALLGGARLAAAEPTSERPTDALPAETESAATPPADDTALFDALDAAEGSYYWDPLEPGNRVVFGFNELVDRYALGPVSEAYSFVMPDPAERAVRRMFRNLTEPVSFVNHALQLQPKPAAVTLSRFCVNSSLGIGGMFDVANKAGLPPQPTDFGGTLYRYGMPAGPYLVLPLFGPTTARDTVGDVVDSSVMPQNYIFSTAIQLVLQTGNGITARAEAGEALDALRDGAVDFYAALRSAYYFNRESELRGGAPGASETLRSSAETSASNPSRSNTEVYSALRSASSDTVPLK
jgi:phospholipid-binding lipoprotein MlaA